ncbi:MAG: carboxypeptidase-like regulatory domain-containing protein, partial [Ignavibacteriaceae bacterium]
MRLFSIIILLVISNFSLAQTGSVKGTVTDGENPIPLVNILIVNTTLGSGTNEEGEYEIRGIIPGQYTLKATA